MKEQKILKGVFVGAGYFSDFHLDAWTRIPSVEMVAGCDLDLDKVRSLSNKYQISKVYESVEEMLQQEAPDFIDVITLPDSHHEICRLAIKYGVHIICQKPVASTFQESMKLFDEVEESDIRFMVHDNWRFQPWYRKIKEMIEAGIIGSFHTMNFRMRMGDGWGDDAYLNRQPYFQTMPRLLIHENGVHFIDTFRYLFGEVKSVFARLRKLNPVIKGEDTAWAQFEFESGGLALLDSGRYNESTCEDPRFTFGEALVEGTLGSIRLYEDGKITLQPLNKKEQQVKYHYTRHGFCGDSVYGCLSHFVESLLNDKPFESSTMDYRKTLQIQEAVYHSSENQKVVTL